MTEQTRNISRTIILRTIVHFALTLPRTDPLSSPRVPQAQSFFGLLVSPPLQAPPQWSVAFPVGPGLGSRILRPTGELDRKCASAMSGIDTATRHSALNSANWRLLKASASSFVSRGAHCTSAVMALAFSSSDISMITAASGNRQEWSFESAWPFPWLSTRNNTPQDASRGPRSCAAARTSNQSGLHKPRARR